MTSNEIEGLTEYIRFHSRMWWAVVAGIYLLIGAVGGYLLEWLEIDEAVRGDFAVVPAAGIAAIIALSVAAVFLYRAINGDIDQIRKSPPEKQHE